MCKILAVELLEIPDEIHLGDNKTDFTVVTKIEFHPIDLEAKMEYCLHLFVYDIHGSLDAPLIIPNWDESTVRSITEDRKDVFLGKEMVMLRATDKNVTIKTEMVLKLGDFGKSSPIYARKLEVFATIAPVVGRASKWSKVFVTDIMR